MTSPDARVALYDCRIYAEVQGSTHLALVGSALALARAYFTDALVHDGSVLQMEPFEARPTTSVRCGDGSVRVTEWEPYVTRVTEWEAYVTVTLVRSGPPPQVSVRS